MINKDKFIILGDATPESEKKALEIFKNSGIDTFVLYPNEKDHYGAIKRLGDAGLNVFIFGGSPLTEYNKIYFEDGIGTFPNFIARYEKDKVDLNNYPQVSGLYMIDEPGADLFPEIKERYIPWFNKNYAGKKIWHVNMLPSYSTDGQLGVKAKDGEDIYETFINKYAEEVQPFIKGIKSLGVDHYPMREKNGIISLSDAWLFDLAVVGAAAKRTESLFSVCIQVFRTDGLKRVESVADVRFQLYTAMAFGASMFEFYAYTTAHGSEAMLNGDGTPSLVYYAVRDAVREIRILEKVYLKFEWEGVKCFAPAGESNAAFEKIKKYQSETLEGISCVATEQSILVSEFKEGDEIAYLVVGYGIPSLSKSNVVTIKFERAEKFIVYQNGREDVVGAENGSLTVLLEQGQGVFILPQK